MGVRRLSAVVVIVHWQGNRIAMIQGLDAIHQLTSLDFAHNRLILLDSIQQATRLTVLDVEANFLNNTQLHCLRQLSQLTSLNIAGNSVTSLSHLHGLRGLSVLRVSRNALLSLVRVMRSVQRWARGLLTRPVRRCNSDCGTCLS